MSCLWRLRLLAAVVIVCVQVLSVGVLPRIPTVEAQDSTLAAAAPNRYIVRLKESAPGFTSAASVASTFDAKPGVAVDQVYTDVFSGFAGEFTSQAASELANDPRVLDVFPDRASRLMADTPLLPGIDRIDAELNPVKAGDGSGSIAVDVAILDTGVYKHPDLNVVGGKDCTSSRLTDQYTDINGHGTHVAGSVAAKDNSDGVTGVAPGARIYAVKIFSDDGGGLTYESEIICGLDYVRGRAGTIEVINMSIGGDYGGSMGGCSASAYHQAICRVVDAGVTVVVAAGNDGADASTYVPAQFPEVITVSAYHDSDGQPGGIGWADWYWGVDDDALVNFSNYGAPVDIAAPGVNILSTQSGGGYTTMSGTSMASPHVAGGAALVIAQQGWMSPASVRARLRLTAEPGPLAGDYDSNKEPLMNVAMLGRGKITVSPGTTVKVGDAFQVRVGDFTPGTRAIFRFNGTYIGGDTIDDNGRGHRNYTIPAMPGGTYKVTVSNGLKSVTKNVTVATTITLSPTSGPVGELVKVTFRGFAKGETVDVRINGRTAVNDKVMSSTGSGSQSFVLPAMPRGSYTVTASGNKGSSTTATFSVKQSAWVSSGTPQPDRNVTVSYRGFKAGESIVIRYDTQSGPVQNGSADIASSTGSGSDTVKIPASTSTGTHYLWLMGDQGTNIRITLSVAGAGLPTPEPTATAEPTEVPTEVPTDVPTEIPTDVPTEEPTEIPTEEPTEVPTEVPTDVPTEAPTELPTAEPTTEATEPTPAEA